MFYLKYIWVVIHEKFLKAKTIRIYVSAILTIYTNFY